MTPSDPKHRFGGGGSDHGQLCAVMADKVRAMLDDSLARLGRFLILVLAALLSGGCHRQDYRLQADHETYGILAHKTDHPHWVIPPFSVQPPPQSRNFDPYNPDHPPMPPDDPAAHVYMHCVDCKRGYPCWHQDGDAPTVEQPTWLKFLHRDEDGVVTLDQDGSVQLALVNSRQYQLELENLYLTALGLTLERFEFDVQWFGINRTDYEHFGEKASGNPNAPDESNRLRTASNLGFRRAFATGAELLVDFANTFVWEFTGTGSHFAFSNLAVRFVQPLLRGALRDVRLESLTQAERDVLYAVRRFARFRKQFYFDIVSGNSGYLSLLLQVQAIRNLEATLESLQQNLVAHEALSEAGIVSQLQVDQVFQSYQEGRLALIRANNNLETALDVFKIRLGLPPELEIEIEDAPLTQFELNSPEIAELEQQLQEVLVVFRELDEPPPRENLVEGFEELLLLHDQIVEQLDTVIEELEQWKSQDEDSSDQQDEGFEEERETEAKQVLTERLQQLRDDLSRSGTEIQLDAAMLETQTTEQAWQLIQRRARQEAAYLSDVFVIQTQIRAYLIELSTTQYEQWPVIKYGLNNRLDLMNRRAEVVDAWRLIRVAADGLEADLDLILEADIATDPGGNNPLKFSSKQNRYLAGIRLDGPLNRLAERNIYRAQLIEFQRARRAFIENRDEIVRAIRRDLRNLEADELNFDIARQQLIVAARQVELARVQLLDPGRPAGDSSTTQDTLRALNSLLAAKNQLIASWVAYETDRLQLLLNMEALQLDEHGLLLHGELTSGNADDLDSPSRTVGSAARADRSAAAR